MEVYRPSTLLTVDVSVCCPSAVPLLTADVAVEVGSSWFNIFDISNSTSKLLAPSIFFWSVFFSWFFGRFFEVLSLLDSGLTCFFFEVFVCSLARLSSFSSVGLWLVSTFFFFGLKVSSCSRLSLLFSVGLDFLFPPDSSIRGRSNSFSGVFVGFSPEFFIFLMTILSALLAYRVRMSSLSVNKIHEIKCRIIQKFNPTDLKVFLKIFCQADC